MNVLVIAAHPDDEVLGCGGTMARLSSEGHRVHVLILGEGVTSRYEQRDAADIRTVAALHQRAGRVAALLGACDLEMLKLPDNRFDSLPLLEIVKHVERAVERTKPDIVFTQHGGDLNIDHVQTFRATLTATRPVSGICVRAVYAYEVASSTEWAFGQFEPALRPTTFIDISATLERKLAAMHLYESETRAFPHPRSTEALGAIAQRWGSVAGCAAAEAFQLVRSVVRGDSLLL